MFSALEKNFLFFKMKNEKSFLKICSIIFLEVRSCNPFKPYNPFISGVDPMP